MANETVSENRTGRRPATLLPTERRQRVFEVILARHTVSVAELAERFAVSAMTIRRDLQALEEQGLVESVHGGAKPSTQNPFELSFAQRELADADAKRAIGALAAGFVQDGEAIALDASTTTLQVARNLVGRQRVTVVTNGIKTAAELGARPGIEVIVTGGQLHQTASLVGPFARATLERLRVDWLFFSVTGISDQLALMGPSEFDAEAKAAMMTIARRVVLVADATKFGRDSYVRVAPLANVHDLVTDARIDAAWRELIIEAGVRLHVAGAA
ncbi:MAG TPA: DeoR/GlpR family DNA-binding transcription regulator [Thermomicrobiales bacterium]|nr:DeoR/GlpR family DNA-binding transcription regulator [Thermomicrobiales bacterium]